MIFYQDDIHNKLSLYDGGGVYFVFNSQHEIIYIGKTHCFRHRLHSTRIIKDFVKFGFCYFKLFWFNMLEMGRVEKELIKMYEPPLNKSFNKNRRKNSTMSVGK